MATTLKKINDFLAGLPMTIVAGVFLLFDLVPHLAGELGGAPDLFFPPAYHTRPDFTIHRRDFAGISPVWTLGAGHGRMEPPDPPERRPPCH